MYLRKQNENIQLKVKSILIKNATEDNNNATINKGFNNRLINISVCLYMSTIKTYN